MKVCYQCGENKHNKHYYLPKGGTHQTTCLDCKSFNNKVRHKIRGRAVDSHVTATGDLTEYFKTHGYTLSSFSHFFNCAYNYVNGAKYRNFRVEDKGPTSLIVYDSNGNETHLNHGQKPYKYSTFKRINDLLKSGEMEPTSRKKAKKRPGFDYGNMAFMQPQNSIVHDWLHDR